MGITALARHPAKVVDLVRPPDHHRWEAELDARLNTSRRPRPCRIHLLHRTEPESAQPIGGIPASC